MFLFQMTPQLFQDSTQTNTLKITPRKSQGIEEKPKVLVGKEAVVSIESTDKIFDNILSSKEKKLGKKFDVHVSVVYFTPEQFRIALFPKGEKVDSFLNNTPEAYAVANGTYFNLVFREDKKYSPSRLVIIGGQLKCGSLYDMANGLYDDIHDKNGMAKSELNWGSVFYITNDGKPHIERSKDFSEKYNLKKGYAGIQNALESGQVLLENGEIPKELTSATLHSRSGLFITSDNRLMLLCVGAEIDRWAFAAVASKLGAVSGLALDGGPSVKFMSREKGSPNIIYCSSKGTIYYELNTYIWVEYGKSK
ncbi:MAG: phosphodiester glycosidase family protein [Candidatus Marsarchaeota archaeon]|nr:phosphodiester glycosidase family protein [Candidatus Marsarchaeota archaeon]